MVDQGIDVLEQNRETPVQILRVLVAPEHIRDQTLLIDDVLAHEHRVFLQLVDVQEEVLVDVFLLVDSLAVLGDLLAHKLDHIRVQIDTLVHNAGEDRVAVRV